MYKLLLASLLSLLSTAAVAANNCDEIKGQIDAKIKAIGVPVYKLDVIDADAETSGKVVGTCEGGKKKVVYWRLK